MQGVRSALFHEQFTSSRYQSQYVRTEDNVCPLAMRAVLQHPPKADPVFPHVKAGMTVIVEVASDWRMADVIWVDRGARNPKVPTLFQVADVDTGVITWVNADLVIHIVPRV